MVESAKHFLSWCHCNGLCVRGKLPPTVKCKFDVQRAPYLPFQPPPPAILNFYTGPIPSLMQTFPQSKVKVGLLRQQTALCGGDHPLVIRTSNTKMLPLVVTEAYVETNNTFVIVVEQLVDGVLSMVPPKSEPNPAEPAPQTYIEKLEAAVEAVRKSHIALNETIASYYEPASHQTSLKQWELAVELLATLKKIEKHDYKVAQLNALAEVAASQAAPVS
jgi:hypothetical protein